MKPQPKSKSDDIIERINRLSSDDIKNSFVIKSIKRDANGLIRSDPRGAYMALGMLACLENKVDKMRDYHEKARRISSDFNTNLNYATSLSKKRFFSEAQKYALKAHEIEPTNIECLSLIIKDNATKGHCREAFEWLEKLKKAFPGKGIDGEDFIISSKTFWDKNNISDDDVRHIQKIAITLLHKRDLYHLKIKCRFLQDEDSAWLSYQIGVGLSPNEIVDLNVELAEKLARENLPSNVANHVDVMYTSQNQE